jgi:subtilisin family serine protease
MHPMLRRRGMLPGYAAVLAALACAPATPSAAPAPAAPIQSAPAPAAPSGPSIPVTRAEGSAVRRVLEPAAAYARGWMPLDATRVPAFRTTHPTYDGRGVIIGILDSGIDPGVQGLESTSTGAPKLLDLRDFSGEGHVPLQPLIPAGDTLASGPVPLIGGAALRELSPGGPWYVGRLTERRLGSDRAADLNGDGDAIDTLALIVAHDSAGWFVLADTDLDGSLAGERPIRDYAVDRRGFAWARYGTPPRINLAVNLADQPDREPRLALYFDTSGHGTHVAGIAAGHRIYGVEGFDGVAPGAQLLGLKIANNAHGAVSTTGSMLAAMDHAIRLAAELRRPLVLNLSFGVGNEREGAARIDALIDSVLAANPALVLAISAGNDGPGLSTVGFPGSASRAISVGATFPGVFAAAPGAPVPPDRIAYFSARGGELAKPDIVAPGIAYSTVPRWNAGQERTGGTSMAAPHVAGLAARLISGLQQEGRPIRAIDVRAALAATAQSVDAPVIARGAGLPDLPAAWSWLAAGRRAPDVRVQLRGGDGSAVLHATPSGAEPPAGQVFELVRPRGAPAATYRLHSDSEWLRAPDSVITKAGSTPVQLRYDSEALAHPGVWTGAVLGWTADTAGGPAFRLLSTVIRPYAAGDAVEFETGPLASAAVSRLFFAADTGRAFRVTVAGKGPASVFLHEPGGRPYRDANARPAGTLARPTIFEVDAADVEDGTYELVVAAPPSRAAAAAVSVRHAPVRLVASRAADAVHATITAAGRDTVRGDAMLLLVGGERTVQLQGSGGEPRSLALVIPEWARSATIDVRHPPGQWERFTDFGVTLFADDGTIIEQTPLNYSFGRLAFEVAAANRGRRASLTLLPGYADSATAGAWSVDASVRFYAEAPVALSPLSGTAPIALAPGAATRVDYPLTDGPWPLGDGFHSLAVLVAEIGGVTWSRELGLRGPASAETE